MHGANNEYMIFPIVDIVRKEVRNMVATEQLAVNGQANQYNSVVNADHNTVVYDDALKALDSHDYELELQRLDPAHPKLLTGVKLHYNERLYELITLIRNNGKLAQVKDSLIFREDAGLVNNPLGMDSEDFWQYAENKRLYEGTADEALKKQLAEDNLALRNQYGIQDDIYAYVDFEPYLNSSQPVYNEKVLFQVMVSLNYNGRMLAGVTSETLIINGKKKGR